MSFNFFNKKLFNEEDNLVLKKAIPFLAGATILLLPSGLLQTDDLRKNFEKEIKPNYFIERLKEDYHYMKIDFNTFLEQGIKLPESLKLDPTFLKYIKNMKEFLEETTLSSENDLYVKIEKTEFEVCYKLYHEKDIDRDDPVARINYYIPSKRILFSYRFDNDNVIFDSTYIMYDYSEDSKGYSQTYIDGQLNLVSIDKDENEKGENIEFRIQADTVISNIGIQADFENNRYGIYFKQFHYDYVVYELSETEYYELKSMLNRYYQDRTLNPLKFLKEAEPLLISYIDQSRENAKKVVLKEILKQYCTADSIYQRRNIFALNRGYLVGNEFVDPVAEHFDWNRYFEVDSTHDMALYGVQHFNDIFENEKLFWEKFESHGLYDGDEYIPTDKTSHFKQFMEDIIWYFKNEELYVEEDLLEEEKYMDPPINMYPQVIIYNIQALSRPEKKVVLSFGSVHGPSIRYLKTNDPFFDYIDLIFLSDYCNTAIFKTYHSEDHDFMIDAHSGMDQAFRLEYNYIEYQNTDQKLKIDLTHVERDSHDKEVYDLRFEEEGISLYIPLSIEEYHYFERIIKPCCEKANVSPVSFLEENYHDLLMILSLKEASLTESEKTAYAKILSSLEYFKNLQDEFVSSRAQKVKK